MKLLASGLIIFSCGAMGFVIASSFSRRVHNLRQLIQFFQILETEISYTRSTLPSVIAQQARQFSGEVGSFLHTLAGQLGENTGESFAAIWERGVARLGENGLPGEVVEELRSCGAVLGRSDAVEQAKHVEQLLKRMEHALQAAQAERERHTRLWQYLGFAAGLLIVLLLL